MLVIALFTVLWLGRGAVPQSKEAILAGLPPLPPGMTWWRAAVPLVILLALALAAKYAAFTVPTLGFPLIFVICALATVAIDPVRRPFSRWLTVVNQTVEQVFPLVATMVSVGVLVNILAATGVRGLIAISFVALPIVGIYATSLVRVPAGAGVAGVRQRRHPGHAAHLRVQRGRAPTSRSSRRRSACCSRSATACRPRASSGRTAIETVGYKGSYGSFLKATAVPWLFMGIVSLVMLMWPKAFAFLVRY